MKNHLRKFLKNKHVRLDLWTRCILVALALGVLTVACGPGGGETTQPDTTTSPGTIAPSLDTLAPTTQQTQMTGPSPAPRPPATTLTEQRTAARAAAGATETTQLFPQEETPPEQSEPAPAEEGN